jgi:hypothetical protein
MPNKPSQSRLLKNNVVRRPLGLRSGLYIFEPRRGSPSQPRPTAWVESKRFPTPSPEGAHHLGRMARVSPLLLCSPSLGCGVEYHEGWVVGLGWFAPPGLNGCESAGWMTLGAAQGWGRSALRALPNVETRGRRPLGLRFCDDYRKRTPEGVCQTSRVKCRDSSAGPGATAP